jgi:hypothetical protein
VLEVKAILIIIKSVAFEKERLDIFERVIYLYKEQNIFVFVILKRGFLQRFVTNAYLFSIV